MKIKVAPNFTVLTDEHDDVKDFSKFLEYQIPKHYAKVNVVVDLLKYDQFSLEDLLTYMKVSTEHRKEKKSFVIVNNSINPDVVPIEIIVVPTLQEAEDIIEMEEIERDLGF